jgi:hypothetical protein
MRCETMRSNKNKISHRWRERALLRVKAVSKIKSERNGVFDISSRVENANFTAAEV